MSGHYFYALFLITYPTVLIWKIAWNTLSRIPLLKKKTQPEILYHLNLWQMIIVYGLVYIGGEIEFKKIYE